MTIITMSLWILKLSPLTYLLMEILVRKPLMEWHWKTGSGAIEVSLGKDSQIMAQSTGGVVNLNGLDEEVKVGYVSGREGVAIYADNDVILEGTLEVSSQQDTLGAIVDVRGKIEGRKDEVSGIMISDTSARLELNAAEGIVRKDLL